VRVYILLLAVLIALVVALLIQGATDNPVAGIVAVVTLLVIVIGFNRYL
jgi:hypothetical protein